MENIPFHDLEQPQFVPAGTPPDAGVLLSAPHALGAETLSRDGFLHVDVNLLNLLRCLGSPQAQRMQGAARADQLEGPWSLWWQAVKFPVPAQDGHTLFLGYSPLLNVWPKKIVTYSLFHLENF